MSKKKRIIENPVDVLLGKLPPQSVDIEEAILGAILLEGNMVLSIVKGIFGKVNPFYSDKHSIIYNAILEIDNAERTTDLLTVANYLKSILESDITPSELIQLTNTIISSAHVEAHCYIVLEKYGAREIIKRTSEHIKKAYDGEFYLDVLADMSRDIDDITSIHSSGSYESVASIAPDLIKDIDFRIENKGKIHGITTGFKDLDEITNGWQKTDLIIIGARPSMGKTALMLNLAINACKAGFRVGAFSMEMSTNQLLYRVVSSESKVPMEYILRGTTYPKQQERVKDAVKTISKYPLFINDEAGLNLPQLRAKVQQMKLKDNIDILFIDYLQLMESSGKNQNRNNDISDISRGIKRLAKELDIPIILLSQLSRSVETRGSKAPLLSDLRDSGAIEQDADIVMFIHREDYQNIEGGVPDELKNLTNLYIRKNRNGRLDKVGLHTDLFIQTFSDMPEVFKTHEEHLKDEGIEEEFNLGGGFF